MTPKSPRTTKYGSSNRETAFDAFRKVAVGVLGITTLITLSFTPALIRLATGPTMNSDASEITAVARDASDAASTSVGTKPVSPIGQPNRVFQLSRDAQGALSLGTTEASSIQQLVQPSLRHALETNGGENYIELSVPVTSPDGSRVVTVLCRDLGLGSRTSCLVLSVWDRIMAPEAHDLLVNSGYPVYPQQDSIQQAIQGLNLPSTSAARKAQVAPIGPNVLDPSLNGLMDRYKAAPTPENLYGVAAGIHVSLLKFVPDTGQILSIQHDHQETSQLEDPDAYKNGAAPVPKGGLGHTGRGFSAGS